MTSVWTLPAVLASSVVLAFVLGGLDQPAAAAPAAEATGTHQEDGGIFFPLRSVELKLWVDGKSGKLLPPPGGVLFSPVLLHDAGSRDAGQATYRLTDPASPGQSPKLPWLSIDAKTGTLKVTEQRVLSDSGARRQHVVWLDGRTAAASRAPAYRSARPFMVPPERARLNITITFELVQEGQPCVNKPEDSAAQPEDPCHYCHDSCFWQGAELQVWENKPATPLGPIGHALVDSSCGDRHQYALKNGTEHFEVRDGELWARESLDRDALANASASQRGPGAFVALSVECRTSWGKVEERVVPVHVLDEDDNAPVLEKDEKLEFNFSTEASLARGAHILVKDLDSRAANRFSELQISDASGIVTHKKLEFDVTHGGVQHTLISIRLQVKDPIEARYNVSLMLTDLTLRDEALKDLRLNVTLWGPPLAPPVAMSSSKTETPQPQPSTGTSTRKRREAVPAPLGRLLITKTAWTRPARYAKFLQIGKAGDNMEYRLAQDSPSWLGVTKEAGILYITDPHRMKASIDIVEHHTVKIVFVPKDNKDTDGQFVLVEMNLASMKGAPECLDANTTCGQYDNKKDCTSHCGVGTGSGQLSDCVWREAQSTNMMTKTYATCSPNLDSCPDTVCDPLEQLDPNICPQDCTGAS